MTDFLLTVVSLLVALSLLIAVHELGHFLVARWSGVKVLRFSIGFGKPLWQRRYGPDQTEYTIATIPLGGYVKMLDEREGDVPEAELHRAFNRQSLAKRSAIVFAGPLFNFLFAILAYWLMFIIGISGIKPLLGDVEPDTFAYEAGLRSGQEILSVDGENTPTWQSVVEAILPKMLLGEPVKLTVFDGGLTLEKQLEFTGLATDSKPEEMYKKLGLKVYQPKVAPVIGEVVSGEVAEKAGLKVGDKILMIENQPIDDWSELVKIVSEHPGKPVSMSILRDGKEMTLNMVPKVVKGPKGPVGKIGAGVKIDNALYQSLTAEMKYGVMPAFTAAVARTWDMSSLTLRMIGEMIVGRTSVENLSGPIGIAQYAKQSAAAGFSSFLKFLGLISVSLGVLNLLPIPVLDGGHLFYYGIEAVRGKPVTERIEALGQRIGLALIFTMMAVAVYNDLARLAAN